MEKVTILKASLSHPKRAYRIGRHTVGAEFAEYSLNAHEQKELETVACQRWLVKGSKKDLSHARKVEAEEPAGEVSITPDAEVPATEEVLEHADVPKKAAGKGSKKKKD